MQEYHTRQEMVEGFLKEACSRIRKGRYKDAADMAVLLEQVDCSPCSLMIYHRLWELTGEERFRDETRRLVIPLAEEQCRAGRHDEEARLYESAGFMPESLAALKEQELYGKKDRNLIS